MIYARERAKRPTEFVSAPVRKRVERCPFCAGNEDATPEAVAVYPTQGDPTSASSWQVRVIPNRYPAVSRASPEFDHIRPAIDGYVARPGYGVHEVIIESPSHTSSFAELTPEQALYSFMAYRDRMHVLAQDQRLRYAVVFKNCRGAGGATLDHTHSQLLAMSIVPDDLQRELNASAEYATRHGGCMLCDMSAREMDSGERIVATTDRLVAYCAYAGRFPYETWILPREHGSSFQLAKLADLGELSALIQKVLVALEKLIPQAPYNYWIHTSPFDTIGYDHYHWHLKLIPRITTQAGFEWGTGCFVNDVLPEDAASALRAIIGG